MRTGESLRAMSDADIFRILSEQEPDFSAKICEGLTIEDLDKEAIAEMKTQYPDFITFLRHHIAHNDNQRVT